MVFIVFKTFLEWPCALSITKTSTPASKSASALSSVFCSVPIAAATLSLPESSLVAFGCCADFCQYINELGLSFDYVEPNTFNDQKEGFWRWQLSWGGPSDEFRIFVNEDNKIYKIEYWYLDWFDGASIIVKDSLIYHIIEEYFLVQ